MNLYQKASDAARRFPAAEALRFGNQVLTYAELGARSAAVATGLRRRGVAEGQRVAIFLGNRPEFILAYLGIVRLGAVAVSLNAGWKRAEVGHVLRDSGASLLLTDSARRAEVPPGITTLDEVLLCDEAGRGLFEAGPAPEGGRTAPAEVDDSAALAILYTSGTTGLPKGAVLTHGGVRHTAEAAARHCGTRPGDRILAMVPLSHCFGQNMLLNHAIAAGATLVLQDGFDPGPLLASIERDRVTMFFAVPMVFSLLLHHQAAPACLRSVRYCHTGAAPLAAETERAWFDRFGVRIHQGYGLTESSPFASYNDRPDEFPSAIGRPIEGVEMRIVDDDERELEGGEVGEIVIRGPNLMKGYWNQPEATAAAIRNGWLHTGDLGRKDEWGNFHLVDRLKDMINVSGLKVYPAEVERALSEHPEVAEAAVYGLADAIAGERVQAAVVLRAGADVSSPELVRFCRERLAAYKVPETISLVAGLPRSPAGKLLRRRLREDAAAGSALPALS